MKIYSKFEYENMLRFQRVKDSFLLPLTKRLLTLNVSANSVSISSGIVAILSFFLSIILNTPPIFIIGIWFHFFLDGLDGSLARLSPKKPAANGLLMDIIFDSVGIAMVGFYVLYFNYVGTLAALFFITIYFAVNLISFILAKINQKYDFVVRPRIFVLLAITLDYIFSYQTTSVVVLSSNVLLAIFFLVGVKKLSK